MVEISDIKDRDSLKAWLTDWPAENGLDEDAARAIAVSIAQRAAMRVLPIGWRWALSDVAQTDGSIILLILRSLFISGVSGKLPTHDVKNASVATVTTAHAITTSANAHSVVHAARGAVITAAAFGTAAADSANATDDAAFAAAGAPTAFTFDSTDITFDSTDMAANFWTVVQADCAMIVENGNLLAAPLWGNRVNLMKNDWEVVKQQVTVDDWAFWIKWYDDALSGRPQDWSLLEKIALIDPEIWDAGPEVVNPIIDAMWQQHELLREARELKAQTQAILQAIEEQTHRAHNNPPELVDEKEVRPTFTLIWDDLLAVEAELEKEAPDPSVLSKLGIGLKGAAKAVALYCASLGDISLKSGATALGPIAVFWALGGPVQALVQKLGEFGTKIFEYVEMLISIAV